MSRFGPYVLFEGTCADAMTFYRTVFGGELSMTTVGDSPMKAQIPEAFHARIVNARLKSELVDITASDWLHPTRHARLGNTVCLYISDGSFDELRMIFNKLWIGADPETLDQLRDLPFGTYGALTDKFGIRWMFQGSPRKPG
jgi:PhnB protein